MRSLPKRNGVTDKLKQKRKGYGRVLFFKFQPKEKDLKEPLTCQPRQSEQRVCCVSSAAGTVAGCSWRNSHLFELSPGNHTGHSISDAPLLWAVAIITFPNSKLILTSSDVVMKKIS